MVFSASIFLFWFLPLVWCIHRLLAPAFKNTWLLFASFVFYYWAEQEGIFLLFTSILINYTAGLAIEQFKAKKVVVSVSILANLALLVYYKYSNFLVENFAPESFSWTQVILPLGISFFTFQGISYILDVYRNEVKPTQSLHDFALYISLFPQLVAGPIVRYADLYDDIQSPQLSTAHTVEGLQRFTIGLFKKTWIANTLALTTQATFSGDPYSHSTYILWIGAISYTLQLYFDFSGYSDMAIGLGKMFGFRFLENFKYPLTATSIKDFWRRWHISLSTWFRDYLYIPLGGNRKGAVRTYLHLCLVFITMGLWHGDAWNFLLFGLWHGLFLVIERIGFERILDKSPAILRHVYTLLVVVFGFVMFNASSFEHAVDYLLAMFDFSRESTSLLHIQEVLTPRYIFFASMACLLSMPLFMSIQKKAQAFLLYPYLTPIFYWVMLILCGIQLAGATVNPFIYFRF